jgi:heme/copper-type cytochrome/quinol oxidase subunit 2
MRARQWLVFSTLGASVLFLVSVAAQPSDPPTVAPSPTDGQEQGATREFAINGNHYVFAPAEIVVDRNDLVKITFTASDIAHSFAIDDYRIVKRAGAGQTVTFEFRADRAGRFPFYCSLSQDAKCRDMKGTLTVR